jgi:hypothetical protein
MLGVLVKNIDDRAKVERHAPEIIGWAERLPGPRNA